VTKYMYLVHYKQSEAKFFVPETSTGLDVSSLLFGLLLLGFDYFCLCLACIGVADIFVRRQFSYALSWWSVVFPTVTLVTAWLQLGNTLDSPTFRSLTAALYMLVVIMYLANWVGTIKGIVDGSLIWAKSEIQREDALVKKAKDFEKDSEEEV
jgi:tellurite resistance protein TehA-like permease